MCGLVGFVSKSIPDAPAVLKRMAEAIRYRGPDAEGYFSDPSSGIALGHKRLSIVDLTATGAQPMESKSGRYILSFNGEIYNHLALRKELAISFRGSSDTETLLESIAEWGVEKTLQKCAGMFAFALWDREKNILTLARDRLGEKPLYYGFGADSTLLFASELKALWQHPDWRGAIDEASIASYLRYGYVPAPHTIFKNFFKLLPGYFAEWKLGEVELQSRPYWKLETCTPDLNEQESIELTETTLKNTIREQMIADVPVGAFLSGGIDSSLVAALMQELSPRPIRTFTIAFQDRAYNEAPIAKEVAKRLGTDHNELMVDAQQALQLVPKLSEIYDEPFADSSQIPTTLLAQLTKKHVTVSLSGDGGDELFAGYNRYLFAPKIWNTLEKIPHPLRSAASTAMLAIPGPFLRGVLPLFSKASLPLDKYYKLARLLPAQNASAVYLQLTSLQDPELFLGNIESRSFRISPGNDFVRAMQTEDIFHYLPDDILVKLDRACMSASLEGRAPLIDYRLLEVSRRIPTQIHLKDGKGKWILREILHKHLPASLFERAKTGFTAPIGAWLRAELREWAEHLLFQVKPPIDWNEKEILKMWEEHQSGKRDWQHQLWVFLMLQSWWQQYQNKMLNR